MKMNKNAGVQSLRTMLFFGIVMFHFSVKGSSLLWGGWKHFLLLVHFS